MTTGEKIYYRRKHKKLTMEELGKICGVSKATVWKWEHNIVDNIRTNTISVLADALDVTPEYLVGWEDDMTAYPSYQPIAEEPADKYDSLNDEDRKHVFASSISNIYHQLYMPKNKSGALFAIDMKDDAMINARIFKGDIVFAINNEKVNNGDIALVLINGDLQPRRIWFYNDRIECRPENPLYPVINYEGPNADNNIYGKCLSVFGELK